MHSYLLYGLEPCPLRKSDLSSLDFVMKMFNISNMDIVKSCQLHFNFDMPSILWAKRARTFDYKAFCQWQHVLQCISIQIT